MAKVNVHVGAIRPAVLAAWCWSPCW